MKYIKNFINRDCFYCKFFVGIILYINIFDKMDSFLRILVESEFFGI